MEVTLYILNQLVCFAVSLQETKTQIVSDKGIGRVNLLPQTLLRSVRTEILKEYLPELRICIGSSKTCEKCIILAGLGNVSIYNSQLAVFASYGVVMEEAIVEALL